MTLSGPSDNGLEALAAGVPRQRRETRSASRHVKKSKFGRIPVPAVVRGELLPTSFANAA